MKKATLRLSDGSTFTGLSFGYDQPVSGEVVFNTAMMGYPESLTDPSFEGQIMVLTYPLVGNYGVPPFTMEANGLATYMESERIHASALIITEYSDRYSHWNATESLAAWLQREHIPAITGIDTRALTKKLREQGVMLGQIIIEGMPEPKPGIYEGVNYVSQVSCRQPILYQPTAKALGKRVCLIDCGVKHTILHYLLNRGVEVMRVPWDFDFNTIPFDALFLSNGPGDPNTCDVTVAHIKQFLDAEATKPSPRPIMGICMGNQLLAKAAGATIFKLKYGHRSHNQPVRLIGSNRCFITSQNHGYAVNTDTLASQWEPMFVNLNDGSNEGIRHKQFPWFSVQFHPEGCSGPIDTEYLFDTFIKNIESL